MFVILIDFVDNEPLILLRVARNESQIKYTGAEVSFGLNLDRNRSGSMKTLESDQGF